MYYNINPEDCFDCKKTGATVNLVFYGFQKKYCQEFINKYRYTKNYVSSRKSFTEMYNRLVFKLKQSIPTLKNLTKELENCSNLKTSVFLRLITCLTQIIPTVAVGPEILDPIIIEANDVTFSLVHKIVETYTSSPIRPIIIILLDQRIQEKELMSLLEKFPINVKVAIQHNSGQTEVMTILKNVGADSISEFIDAYSEQCFCTCGYTDQKILLQNSGIDSELSKITSLLMKSHSALLIDSKIIARDDINKVNYLLSSSNLNQDVYNMFKCINSIKSVYANDVGGQDINTAIYCSKQLNNPLLTAFVNKYAYFFPNTSTSEKIELLNSAQAEFSKNNLIDHKLYCINNSLTYSFYSYNIEYEKFNDVLAEAISEIPGMAGLSILYTNTGTALLYNRNPREALDKYKTGLDYAQSHNRPAQRIGLLGNIAIAEALTGIQHDTAYYVNTANDMINMPNTNNLSFIQINGLLNLVASAHYFQNKDAVKLICSNKEFKRIINDAISPNRLGINSLLIQIKTLSEKGVDFSGSIEQKNKISTLGCSGVRYQYISEHGFNPAINNAWL